MPAPAPFIAQVFVRGGRAFLPEFAFTDAGMYWPHGPVHEVDLSPDALVRKIDELIAKGHPSISHPQRSELDKSTTIQKALRVRSWKKMARQGIILFVLYRRGGHVYLARSPQGTDDVQRVDYGNAKSYPDGTSTEEIVGAILQELQSGA